ncbi:MAG TPA: acyl-CoA dehydrogenase family protein, partial [Ilumatobacteraceae bacterium]|nr:acyl-CoA dehydrogenase family protein [Ilumatobacteraceae bacterium]
MQFRFDSEQIEFAAGLRELLQKEFTASHLRAVWDAGRGHDDALWSKLAGLGVFGMLVPEDNGGFGGDMVDAVLLAEEFGRAAVPGPAFET